ncbi:beta 1-4 rhamnosyltransferase Cps2T [Streptococcus suis]|uniref:beta 1-4 rhamnosyltransferase Cps2T n=1 Tax=Streptococcus suis TaxID=1307 RepID=UPI00041C30D5|nr:glycosyltransferase family 1 protein [Streptococcus suis]ANC99569.1 glycosyl transferase [Streptococcus suis]AOM74291.1 glycosyl transferase [Streptococcus suis]MBL6514339.1 glycosyltransferase family 1 protein [Streptococcus suis]MBS8057465.1 glycosyltransferase family 1 protein [Streptococcus suis]MBS8112838.1 glycosyltransferase family 1 protein [Streptococcus suis]
MKHVFIIGSRGLPAKYGGFETFVQQLVSHQQSEKICYHVACLSDTSHRQHSTYLGADCFTINPPKLGPARVIAYDMMAITYALKIIKEQQIERPIFYILGNTIGGFIVPFAKMIHSVGGTLFVNPDGLEWKRAKWAKPVQHYLKFSEKMMVRYADLIVADNEGIEDYLQSEYSATNTTFIAYGTDLTPTTLTNESEKVRHYFEKWKIKEKEYYLIVGRFVPENNYVTAIKEFMFSKTKRDLVIVANHEGSAYFQQLKEETDFASDPRVKFVGTVYDQELLKYLRQECRAYIHGHEVGGTNPGLLEALAQTNENLVLGVDFNKKVALQGACYWSKDGGNLAHLINQIDGQAESIELGKVAKKHMQEAYTWEKIAREYEELFLR